MTVSAMTIRHNERDGQHGLGLDRATRDAIAVYARQTWATGTAKQAARAWGLSVDEARSVVAGRASQATIDKIFKHPNGGWEVVLPVLGAVIGHGVEQFFRQQMIQAAKAAENAKHHEALAQAAYRRLEVRSVEPREDWEDRPAARKVGASEARRMGS